MLTVSNPYLMFRGGQTRKANPGGIKISVEAEGDLEV